MSAEDHKKSIAEHMQLLERRANIVRSRLLRTVDALDTRRHQVTEIGVNAKEAAPRIGLALLGIAALSVGAVLGIRSYLESRRERVFGFRVKRFMSGFHVERRPSFAAQMMQKLAMTGLTVLATEGTRRAMKNVLDGRFPDGRMAVGTALEAHHQELSRPG